MYPYIHISQHAHGKRALHHIWAIWCADGLTCGPGIPDCLIFIFCSSIPTATYKFQAHGHKTTTTRRQRQRQQQHPHANAPSKNLHVAVFYLSRTAASDLWLQYFAFLGISGPDVSVSMTVSISHCIMLPFPLCYERVRFEYHYILIVWVGGVICSLTGVIQFGTSAVALIDTRGVVPAVGNAVSEADPFV